jgi:aspartyl-tRNA(Asn)/glutamyl-tRNA(Gln) amidotransferase subunit C
MKIDVKKVAKLANLSIDPADEPRFEKQLTEILGYVDQLKKVDTDGVEITTQVTGLENVKRDDISTQSLSADEALSGAKKAKNGMFEVPAILEE